mmetsp:Transcript_80634/g.261284  ORF Transcript_80634/g.261284 Transcript_80634/m.261284 type:complete len:288 (+) Transcript_80634:233-1096(+)
MADAFGRRARQQGERLVHVLRLLLPQPRLQLHLRHRRGGGRLDVVVLMQPTCPLMGLAGEEGHHEVAEAATDRTTHRLAKPPHHAVGVEEVPARQAHDAILALEVVEADGALSQVPRVASSLVAELRILEGLDLLDVREDGVVAPAPSVDREGGAIHDDRDVRRGTARDVQDSASDVLRGLQQIQDGRHGAGQTEKTEARDVLHEEAADTIRHVAHVLGLQASQEKGKVLGEAQIENEEEVCRFIAGSPRAAVLSISGLSIRHLARGGFGHPAETSYDKHDLCEEAE